MAETNRKPITLNTKSARRLAKNTLKKLRIPETLLRSNLKIFASLSSPELHIAYLLTGSNLGDRQAALDSAAEGLEREAGKILNRSAYYETAAWGKTDQPAFLNQALAVQTGLNPKQVLRRALKVEKQMGRVREEKYGPRVIDIDLIFFDQQILHLPFLRLPHPQVQNRRFALIPLVEIAPDFIHPVLHKTVTELLVDCKDELPVVKWE